MDHWLSLYNHIVALLEALGEREATLAPSSLGALQGLVKFFCDRVCAAPPSTDLSQPRAVRSPRMPRLLSEGNLGKETGPCLNPISEEEAEDALSIPDRLPDLVDVVEEEERPSPTGLVEKGILPPGLSLYRDRVRPNRFWVY